MTMKDSLECDLAFFNIIMTQQYILQIELQNKL